MKTDKVLRKCDIQLTLRAIPKLTDHDPSIHNDVLSNKEV